MGLQCLNGMDLWLRGHVECVHLYTTPKVEIQSFFSGHRPEIIDALTRFKTPADAVGGLFLASDLFANPQPPIPPFPERTFRLLLTS